jgi:hypothetical protein
MQGVLLHYFFKDHNSLLPVANTVSKLEILLLKYPTDYQTP